MTLVINLTPEEEIRLEAVAREEGMPVSEYARRLLIENLPVLNEAGQADADAIERSLQEYVGSLNFEPVDVGSNTEKYFGEIAIAKHRSRGVQE